MTDPRPVPTNLVDNFIVAARDLRAAKAVIDENNIRFGKRPRLPLAAVEDAERYRLAKDRLAELADDVARLLEAQRAGR